VVAGAKVQAMTILDLMTKPEVVTAAWDYFNNVQTKDVKYVPFVRAEDKPAIWTNKATMDKYRPEMKKYYYDSTKYGSYLEQLGIKYPTVRPETSSATDHPAIYDESDELVTMTLSGASF
jgi:aminobenzoyl-glutamate utilization protein B